MHTLGLIRGFISGPAANPDPIASDRIIDYMGEARAGVGAALIRGGTAAIFL